MAIPKFEADLNIISKLVDEPNDEGGMSAQALKEEFDRAGLLVKEYINDILVPQANIDIDNAAKGIGGSDGMDGSTIVDGTVTAAKLASNSVTAEKIAGDAVTAEKIAPKAVTEEAFADASIPSRAYKQGSVDAAALAQNSVTADKIAEGAVTGAKLANGSVDTAKIADAAVTRAKLAQDALYSPVREITTTSYALSVANIGETLRVTGSTELTSADITFNLNLTASQAMPKGTEIAILWLFGKSIKVVTSGGVRTAIMGGAGVMKNASFNIVEKYAMIALKKISHDATNGDIWTIQGNVEVVE